MAKSGFNKLFKDGTGGLRAGGSNSTKAMESSERKTVGGSVWGDSIPVGYWDMSDGTGIELSDVSSAGNDLNGTLKGASDDYPVWDSTNKIRGSYSLLFNDGSSQATWMADNDVLDFNVDDSFSMSAWIKRENLLTANASIAAKLSQYSTSPDTNYEGYELYLKGGKQPTFLLYQDGSNKLETHGGATTEINDTDWHHILVTYSGNADLSGVQIYIDGAAATMTETTDTLDTSDDIVTTTDFSIGARGKGRTTGAGTRNHFDGNIDEVAIWSKALSTDEIADVYNDGDANDLTDGIPKS
tara:strand:+ start:1148 stop:2044 length:897 start_codon:yes stop_codon:yes gene_type:complete